MAACTSRAIRRTGRQLGRLLVYGTILLSLWQAPVVWLHRHADAAEHSAALPKHLQAFHAADEQEAASAGDWHLHLAFVDDIARGGGTPVAPDKSPETPRRTIKPVVPNSVCVMTDGVAIAPNSFAVSDAHPACLAAQSGLSEVWRPAQPLADFCIAHRLLPLLCVARC